MKCPKCSYLGFENTDRCKNCGYDFSLVSSELPAPQLPIRPADPLGPLTDLSLREEPARPARESSPRENGWSSARPTPRERVSAPAAVPAPPSSTPDLPLFGEPHLTPDDLPLVTAPSTPRPPLSVRRSPMPVRSRTIERQAPPEREPELALEVSEPPSAPEAPAADRDASLVRRLLAGSIDLTLVAVIDAAVIYLTLRLCRLPIAELHVLPWVPMAGFFALLNGGYFVAFTAAVGQTIGKMAAGIRVVAPAGEMDVKRAVLRTCGCVASGLPLGFGFLLALFGPGHRTLHDRIAGTRVVNVGSPA